MFHKKYFLQKYLRELFQPEVIAEPECRNEFLSASTIFAGSGEGPGVKILNKNRTSSRSRIFNFSWLDSRFH